MLRPALNGDRATAYRWLAASDATASMMGPPDFPDHSIPAWQQFCADYHAGFFSPRGDGNGRLFVLRARGRDIGCIGYDGLERWHGFAELDLWIGSASDWGHGFGSQALRQLSQDLLAHATILGLVIRPSARNARAVAAYRKAGFVDHDPERHAIPSRFTGEGLDYADAIVLVRTRER